MNIPLWLIIISVILALLVVMLIIGKTERVNHSLRKYMPFLEAIYYVIIIVTAIVSIDLIISLSSEEQQAKPAANITDLATSTTKTNFEVSCSERVTREDLPSALINKTCNIDRMKALVEIIQPIKMNDTAQVP